MWIFHKDNALAKLYSHETNMRESLAHRKMTIRSPSGNRKQNYKQMKIVSPHLNLLLTGT